VTAQWFIVAVAVVASAAFSLWRLLAARQRLRLLDTIGRTFPGLSARSRLFGKTRAKVLAELAHGCGACATRPPVQRGQRGQR